MYNVKDIEYGAKGDGVADDRKAIQMAIDACGNAGGGDVFFPVGTYLVSRASTASFCFQLIHNKIKLMGENRERSIIKQDLVAPSVQLVNIKSNDCGLSNLTLDGQTIP